MIWIYIISGLVTAVLCWISFRIGYKTRVKQILKELETIYNDSPEENTINYKEVSEYLSNE